jgi:hypothetical protein
LRALAIGANGAEGATCCTFTTTPTSAWAKSEPLTWLYYARNVTGLNIKGQGAMSKRYPWYRFYSETVNDRKIKRITRVTGLPKMLVLGAWATLMSLANDSPVRGSLLFTDDLPMSGDEIQDEMDLDDATFDALVGAFEAHQMVHFEEGCYVVTNFLHRNFKSDHDGAQRVARYRARKKNATAEPNVTPECNVTETSQKRNCNTPDPDPDPDPETEIAEQEPSPSPPPEKTKTTRKPTPLAVQTFRKNAHRYPAKSWYDQIEATVGEDRQDLDRWGETVHVWVGLGWKPTNVIGMLECYQRGELPGSNGRLSMSTGPPPQQTPTTVSGLQATPGWMNGEPTDT